MKLEVLLSVMNLDINQLSKMNITCDATVINQCNTNDFQNCDNFKIYSYCEKGLSNSRNRGLQNVTGDIIILCDDDMVYNKEFEQIILNEFKKNKEADIITFNINSPNRKIKMNKKEKRLHLYNVLRYTSCRIAFRRSRIEKAGIKFNVLFGAGAKYSSGEDSLFLVDALNKKLKIYSSIKNIGTVHHNKSTWFRGYDEKYFFDKGALFTAINKKIRILLILQFLLRHKEMLKQIKFRHAFRLMLNGSRDYLNEEM